MRVPTGYGFLRALVRWWLNTRYRKIRLLHSEGVMAAAAPIVVAGHPASFVDALVLIAALEPPVRCLVPLRLLRGAWRSFLARNFGMIGFEAGIEPQAFERCSDALAAGEIVAVFSEPPAAGSGAEAGRLGAITTGLAVVAEGREAGPLGVTVFPAHLYLPARRRSEALIYLDRPIVPADVLSAKPSAPQALAAAIEAACHENAFRLQPREVEYLLSDLEEILRADLEEDWAERPDWKQSAAGFELSSFVAEGAQQMNDLDPGRLVALRQALDDYREDRRRYSLRQFEMETGDAWINSKAGRALIWLETVLGFPVALFGLVNHVVALLVLRALGLLKKSAEPSARVVWLYRALAVLACYTVQVLLCARWFGRAAAGYYTLALPVSGAYMWWRYRSLLSQRTRLAFAALRARARAANLGEQRRRLVEDLNRALQGFVASPGVMR